MRFDRSSWIVGLALVLGAAGAGCKDKHSGSVGPGDAGDAAADGVGMSDGGKDTPAGFMCPGLAAGEMRALGACCQKDADCSTATCWNGFCTKACGTDADCGAAVAPSPLPPGTVLKCATNMLMAPFNLCMPGSLGMCSGAGATEGCPAGEGCVLGIDPAAKAPILGLRGTCMTKLIAGKRAGAGVACDPDKGPYECEHEGGYMGQGCVARRCTHACTFGDDAACPAGMVCGGPVAFGYKPAAGGRAVLSGFGLCLPQSCGSVRELGSGAVSPDRRMGADALCDDGKTCVPSVATGIGDTLELSCAVALPDPAAVGAACGEGIGRCKDASLCLDPSVSGGVVSGAAFCSLLCRRDEDCPASNVCLDYPGPKLPSEARAILGYCTPIDRIAAKVCQTQADCGANEGCNRMGDRSTHLVCGLRGAQDPAGAACTDDSGCTAPRRCIFKDAAGKCTDVTAWKEPGEACSNPGQCRSGDCRDKSLLSVGGGTARAFCVAPCLKNSDCGASGMTRCQRTVFSNNGTLSDPTDDVVYGYCRPLSPSSPADGCTDDDFCKSKVPGSDTCDNKTGACFKAAVKIGQACSMDAECGLGQRCQTGPRFIGGACLQYGCDPKATSGIDFCPGAESVCAQRFQDDPIWSCYEGCTVDKDCDRYDAFWRCDSPKPTDPKSICMHSGSGS